METFTALFERRGQRSGIVALPPPGGTTRSSSEAAQLPERWEGALAEPVDEYLRIHQAAPSTIEKLPLVAV
jgi:hypothetical protein